MTPRDPDETHRQATFLELFFDLCFVVAVAQAASGLHHALSEGHAASGVTSYLTVFFAIWWAWMNFTWLASAYDNDDVPFRLATFVQIAGALVLAAGVPSAFERGDFDIAFLGYVILRTGLVALWLRAARWDPARRRTALRYAVGVSAAMLGWGALLVAGWPLWGWWAMAAVELAVPAWAESAGKTPWHPGHVAERYGLFTIIVLGESVLAATVAVRAAVGEGVEFDGLLREATLGGLLILFSLWWVYFAKPSRALLTSNLRAFAWGYGHYFVFAAAAAVGAGIAVQVDRATGHTALDGAAAAATVTVPVAVFLLAVWALLVRPFRIGGLHAAVGPLLALACLGATFAPAPILATGGVLAVGVAIAVAMARPARAPAPGEP